MKKSYGNRQDYFVESIGYNVYRISEFGASNCYLIIGNTKALLIDVGTGMGDLLGCVRKLTNLPIEVVGTHYHPDHIGGMGQFESIHIHELDINKIHKFMTNLFSRKLLLPFLPGAKHEGIKFKDIKRGNLKTKIIPINDQTTFDLGDRIIHIKNLPSHTIGSCALFDDVSKIMFVGDIVYPCTWLHLPDACPLLLWHKAIKEIYNLCNDYIPYYAHFDGKQTVEKIQRLIKNGDDILKKYKRNSIFSIFRMYPRPYKGASVMFRTGNLYPSKKYLKKHNLSKYLD